MEIDYFKSIQILALESVMSGNQDYMERVILRWFSKTFSTPYPQVLEMPFEEVLQAFWEDHFTAMDEDARKEAKFELLESPEERSKRIAKQEAEDAMLSRIMNEAADNNKKITDVVKTEFKPIIPVKTQKEVELPKELKNIIKPDIDIKFASSEEEFEKLLNTIDSQGTKPQQS